MLFRSLSVLPAFAADDAALVKARGSLLFEARVLTATFKVSYVTKPALVM